MLRRLYVDHCSLSYAAQRHIAAGIVSNSNLALRVMSGFPLGAISVTLGLPGALETWSNEQVLKFIRVMWHRYRQAALSTESSKTFDGSTPSILSAKGDASECSAAGSNHAGLQQNTANDSASVVAEKAEPKTGPSDPATVVAAAKSAFEALGDAGGALLLTEEPQRSLSESSPMVSMDAVMLEKTPSGTIRVPTPPFDEDSNQHRKQLPINEPRDVSSSHKSNGSVCTANGKDCPETPVDPAAKKRNMDWLRLHFRSLNEMIQLPYVYADLLQLYRYFYSPVDVGADSDESSVTEGKSILGFGPGATVAAAPQPQTSSGSSPHQRPKPQSSLQRKISYRGLHDVMMGHQPSNNIAAPNLNSATESSCKRRTGSDQSMQPKTKRARNDKPRIDYFPRLKAKIEQHLSSSKQTKALVLLRQLKFVERTMFHGGNLYCDQSSTMGSNSSSEPVATDAEVILIDMF